MISDERLKQALNAYMEATLAELDAVPETEHVFSPRFERRMKRLIYRVDHPVAYRLTRVAAVFLALFLTGFTWLSFDTAAREQLLTWLREPEASSFAYRFQGQDPVQAETYRPTWIPDGYRLTDVWDDFGNVTVIYRNDTEGRVYFQYMPGNDGTALYILETIPPETVKVHNYPADYYPSGEQGKNSSLVWIDDTNGILFALSADLTLDDLLKIAESVRME